MRRERIDLTPLHGMRRHRRWRSGTLNGHDERFLIIGQLPDGRWVTAVTGDRRGARVCRDERDAYDVADWVMAQSGQTWQRVPAEYDARHEPTEGGWQISGQRWWRDDEQRDGPSDTGRHGEGA